MAPGTTTLLHKQVVPSTTMIVSSRPCLAGKFVNFTCRTSALSLSLSCIGMSDLTVQSREWHENTHRTVRAGRPAHGTPPRNSGAFVSSGNAKPAVFLSTVTDGKTSRAWPGCTPRCSLNSPSNAPKVTVGGKWSTFGGAQLCATLASSRLGPRTLA